MKIRTDYVSNSSSSSFMLVGQAFEYDELVDAYHKMHQEDTNEDIDSYEAAETLADDLGLEYCRGISEYYDMYAIGLPFSKMGDDETKRQFIDRVKNALSKAFGDDVEVEELVDGGYDG